MKRIAYGAALCSIATVVACSRNEGSNNESLGATGDPLTYAPLGPLTKKSFNEPNEANRQANTLAYYNTIQVSANGTTNIGTISAKIPTLADFQATYGFSVSDTTAYYYNRGDLGIGREMHCVDRLATTGQIACYVRNFAAGDDQSEFRFGESQDIAFRNMDANTAFATVAMVFRKNTPNDKVFFVVYGADNHLASAAPLDRHGFNFALGKVDSTNSVGTPGVNFNNHIPSNCINCHGGSYDPSLKRVTGGLFLPFDLDQFEYQNTAPSRTRPAQEPSFKSLNTIARNVAVQVGGTGTEVVNQIDGWYRNGTFDSTYVPAGWNGNAQDRAVYASVVRGSCRGCHTTSPLSFASSAGFPAQAVANDLCSMTMPHALQNLREFWQSTKPLALENYFLSTGQTTAANTLHACSPKSVVTLDPHRVEAATNIVF